MIKKITITSATSFTSVKTLLCFKIVFLFKLFMIISLSLKFFGFQQNVNDVGENACCQEEECYHNYCTLISCG